PYWRATASPRSAVGRALARTRTSPTCITASCGACDGDAGGVEPPQPASAAQSARIDAARARVSVIGGGQLAAALGGVGHRAVDQFAQAAGFEGLDRCLRGAAG